VSTERRAEQTRRSGPETSRSKTRIDKSKPPIPIWTGQDYARIAPGRYSAAAVRIIAPQYLRSWKRWSMGVCFRPFSEPDAEVVLFLNLGEDMKPKRASGFFRAWTMANGELPKKGQKMDSSVFLEDQIYEIEVVDAAADSTGERKANAEIYSKVKRIICVSRARVGTDDVVSINRGR
jgi:hypothetical protein